MDKLENVNVQWRLLRNSNSIKTHQENEELGGLSFHEWLLTNKDPKAFDIWKSIRLKEKNDGTYNINNWANSAALIIYSNLPERLDILDKEEWAGAVFIEKLVKNKIEFQPNKKFPKSIQEKLKFNAQSSRPYLSAIELSILSGSKSLIKRAIKIKKKLHKEKGSHKDKSITSLAYYLRFCSLYEGSFPIDTISKLLNNVCGYKTHPKEMSLFFNDAIKKLNTNQLKIIWEEMNDNAKRCFIDSFDCVFPNIQRYLLGEERIDVIKYITSLVNNKNQKKVCLVSFDYFIYLVREGKSRSVEFLVDKSPGWLYIKKQYHNNEGLVIKEFYHALSCAIERKDDNMTKTLLSKAKKGYSFYEMWDCVDNGLYQSVDILLDKNPEWLESKYWVFKNGMHSKKSTPLSLATINSDKKMMDLLLSKGACLKPLKELLNHAPLTNDKYVGMRFMANAERILIRSASSTDNIKESNAKDWCQSAI